MTPLLYVALQATKENPDQRWGICRNVHEYILKEPPMDADTRALMVRECGAELAKLIDKWPKKATQVTESFTRYPVEGNYRIYDANRALGILWKDPRRIALLDWLMEQ